MTVWSDFAIALVYVCVRLTEFALRRLLALVCYDPD